MSNVEHVTLIFEGHVQGVGFRATVRAFANELGILASAENLSDGTVKVILQANKSQCDALIKKLQDHFQIKRIRVVKQN